MLLLASTYEIGHGPNVATSMLERRHPTSRCAQIRLNTGANRSSSPKERPSAAMVWKTAPANHFPNAIKRARDRASVVEKGESCASARTARGVLHRPRTKSHPAGRQGNGDTAFRTRCEIRFCAVDRSFVFRSFRPSATRCPRTPVCGYRLVSMTACGATRPPVQEGPMSKNCQQKPIRPCTKRRLARPVPTGTLSVEADHGVPPSSPGP